MSENVSNGVLFGLCGLGVVCTGLLFIVLLAVLRVTGGGLFSLLPLLVRNVLTRDRQPQTITLPRRRADLRARAQAVDFDSALAQAEYEAQHGPLTPPASAPLVTESPFDPDPPDANPPRRRPFPDEDALIDEDG